MLKKIAQLFENLFVAISFAESGEFDTAREILRQQYIHRKKDRIRPQQQIRPHMRA
ncbi:hypothetical protein [Thermodesulfovibrio sp. TK110]